MRDLTGTWKLSELNISKSSKIGYSIKGNLVNITERRRFLVPFGAIDASYQLAYDKSVSELCERATWLNMYKIAPKLISNTIGFAAHPVAEDAVYQSIAERFERQNFRMLIKLLSQHKTNVVLNYFAVSQWSHGIDFLRTTEVCGRRVCLVVRSLCTPKRVYFGMGKVSSVLKSKLDALGECLLVQESLDNMNIKNDVKSEIMSSGDINYFRTLSESAPIRESLDTLRNHERIISQRSKRTVSFGEEIITVNVSRYIPKFLNPLKRVVFYSFPKSKAELYIQTFLE